jgi:hypothetical protein
MCRYIVDSKGPNTDDLVFSAEAGGGRKPVQLALMADRWVDDPRERAACQATMDKENIWPLLTGPGSHRLGDSCQPWRPTSDGKQVAE